ELHAGEVANEPDPMQLVLLPAQDRPNPADQLSRRERLRDVVVGAELEPFDAILARVAGAQQDDRRCCLALQRADDVRAEHPRHHHVQDQEVVLGAPRRRERCLAVGDRVDLELLPLEGVGDRVEDALLVVGDEDPVHGAGPSAAGSTTRAVVPPPALGPISTSPPSARTASRTMVRPIPSPWSSGDLRRTRSRSLGPSPWPVSRTSIATVSSTREPTRRMLPESVCLAAFAT